MIYLSRTRQTERDRKSRSLQTGPDREFPSDRPLGAGYHDAQQGPGGLSYLHGRSQRWTKPCRERFQRLFQGLVPALVAEPSVLSAICSRIDQLSHRLRRPEAAWSAKLKAPLLDVSRGAFEV